ncbi:MOSC domain-containing protein [Paenibacillus piri]|uniref:MOSC domain-containing protein n=1 Tax=Paenibacillus piri TaxID=2547395 RepID=A0A4R5KMW4_9BACL|nr:MOSC domain-containing protein [Paenibacillus piri]TDF96275.1 MOSC domain-containing protein [Paenibacillus piri]
MSWLVGKIHEINRYPVKSFAGESLDMCDIETYGLYGDRFCAFYEGAGERWESYVTARAVPRMLAYRAKLIEGGVTVTSPDGRTFRWNEELLAEIQSISRRNLSMTSCPDRNFENGGLMAVDLANILIVTDVSLRKLESVWDKRLDPRRFRANLIVVLDEDALHENDWIGKRLSIGGAELQVDRYCKRCSMITLDPDTLERDATLLKQVHERLDLNFGVYASVIKTGQVRVGDNVYVAN